MSDQRGDVLVGCCTRRAVVGGIAASLLPVQSARGAQAAARSGVIDVHHHIVPPFYKESARAWLTATASNVAEVLAWTPERSLDAMDRAGVQTAIMSVSAPALTFATGRDAIELARRCNDYAAQVQRNHPDRFRFFAVLPMPDVAGSIAEAARAVDALGAVGVGLLSNYGGRYLGDPAFAPLFDAAAAGGKLVYVHPTSAPCCQGLIPGVLDPLLEFPVDTGRTITSLLWSGRFSRSPSLRFIFSHGGGIVPMIAERIASAGFINPALAARVPEGARAALATLFVDTASVANPQGMAALRAMLPENHILFGTDFPWGDLARSLGGLERLDLPDTVLRGIERDNARRLIAIG